LRLLSSVIIGTVLLFSLVLYGCVDINSSMTESLPDRVTYVDHIKPIFDRQCIRCHGVDEMIKDLDLRSYSSIHSSDDFLPGDANSFALLKLKPADVSIRSMYIYLNDVRQYDLIYQWIVVDSLAEE